MMSNPKDDKRTEKPTPTRKGVPPEMELEPVPMPDKVPETGTAAGKPPARSGQSEKREKQTEGAGEDNPIHHTGRVPSKVTRDDV